MVLKNPRHERFAQARAEGKSADEAYQLAGYSENRSNAARMNSNERIQDRIAEIIDLATRKIEVTIESLLREADDLQRLAISHGQISAANGALKLKAVFAGLYVEKAENTNRSSDPNALSDDKLADIVAAEKPAPPRLEPVERSADEPLN